MATVTSLAKSLAGSRIVYESHLSPTCIGLHVEEEIEILAAEFSTRRGGINRVQTMCRDGVHANDVNRRKGTHGWKTLLHRLWIHEGVDVRLWFRGASKKMDKGLTRWSDVLDKMHNKSSPDVPPGSLLDPTRPPSPSDIRDFPGFNVKHVEAEAPDDGESGFYDISI